MDTNKEIYDFVCSLGGNCTVANNLKQRSMRLFSLPFDWTYIVSENAINNLAKCFKENFKNILLKENLKELTEDEYNQTHADKAQYKDTYTEYYYVNHFSQKIENSNEYEIVKKKIDRRIKRMLDYINKSNKILLILGTNFLINEEPLFNLLNTLKEIYPNKTFDIVSIAFSCPKDDFIKYPNIIIYRHKRKDNLYDYTKTNYEWAFLDNIKIKWDKITKLKSKFKKRINKYTKGWI